MLRMAFWGKKETYLLGFCLKKVAALLPFRKKFKFGLNQRFLTLNA